MHSIFISNVFLLLCVPITVVKARQIHVLNHLQNALDSALPGDTIVLQGGTFTGPFIARTSGNKTHPITLTTSLLALDQTKIRGRKRKTKFSGSGKDVGIVGLTILGNHWTISLVKLLDFDTGILLKGRDNRLDTVTISDVRTAVNVQGTGNTLKYCMLTARKLGIYIAKGGDRTHVMFNLVTASDTAIVTSRATCCGHFVSNEVKKGKVKISGSSYLVSGHSRRSVTTTNVPSAGAGGVKHVPLIYSILSVMLILRYNC